VLQIPDHREIIHHPGARRLVRICRTRNWTAAPHISAALRAQRRSRTIKTKLSPRRKVS